MVCQACGNEVGPEVRFCPRCGAQVAAAAPQPAYAGHPPYPPVVAVPRVQRNLQTLGILWCVMGFYRLAAGMIGLFFVHTHMWHLGGWPMGHFGGFHSGFFPVVVPLMVTATVVMTGVALTAGYGLLARKPWGRILGIIAAILALFKFPLGTALGIYTLWVLASAASAAEYDAIADRS
jgi:hypothetical protein